MPAVCLSVTMLAKTSARKHPQCQVENRPSPRLQVWNYKGFRKEHPMTNIYQNGRTYYDVKLYVNPNRESHSQLCYALIPKEKYY